MFGLSKPKTTCEELAAFFAANFVTLVIPGMKPEVDEELNLMIECGAADDRIRSEMAAFCAFAYFRGMLRAFEVGTITRPQFDRLETAYTKALEQKVRIISSNYIPSLEYDTFAEWLAARLQRYTLVVASASKSDDVTNMLVEHFSDFACNGDASGVLHRKFYTTFESTVANTAKMIASHRVR